MYQATDSRQSRRQRQKGSSPVPGNKRTNADVYTSRCPGKAHFCRAAMRSFSAIRHVFLYRESVKSTSCANIVTDHPYYFVLRKTIHLLTKNLISQQIVIYRRVRKETRNERNISLIQLIIHTSVSNTLVRKKV